MTGVRLAALSMRQGADIDTRLLEPHVDAQYVMEYLFTEVFSKQPPVISLYLLATQLEKIENLIFISPPNGSVKVKQIRSHCDALRSFQHYISADGESALKLARSACENIPIQHKRARLPNHSCHRLLSICRN